jgi:hypothetical protein
MKVPGRTAVALVVLCMAAVLPRVWAQEGVPATPQTPKPERELVERLRQRLAEAPEARRADELEAQARQLNDRAKALDQAGALTPEQAAEMTRASLQLLREAAELRRALYRGEQTGGTPSIFWAAAGAAPQVVVIPTKAMEDAQVAAIEEDLAVMSRVLEKALRATMGEGEVPERSGMFTPLLGSPERQGIYLGGYGAVFITSVRFPLAGPQEPQEQKPAEQPRSRWDETKREMEGASPMGVGGFSGGPAGGAVTGIGGPAAGAWPRHDPARVENLKTALIETLREASHIREMAGDDSVTVIVWGPPEAEAMTGGTFYAEPGTPGGSAVISVLARTNAVTVIDEKGKVVSVRRAAALALTVQTKKADIDAFAAGKLTFDEFRKRATVAIR